VRWHPPP